MYVYNKNQIGNYEKVRDSALSLGAEEITDHFN